MSDTKDTNATDADAYYGDDDANTEELDLSFLDQDDSDDDK
jgi:hypothetical protein